MSERISGAELDALALEATTKATEPETANVSAQLLIHVIDEVRRLRGLIARQDEAHSYADNLVDPDFEAEARAIRDEGLTGVPQS